MSKMHYDKQTDTFCGVSSMGLVIDIPALTWLYVLVESVSQLTRRAGLDEEQLTDEEWEVLEKQMLEHMNNPDSWIKARRAMLKD